MQVLDVTLRDGGNRNNFDFSEGEVQAILHDLDASGVDYIEIGYRNGAIRPVADIGWAGMCKAPYLSFCAELIRHSKIAVMVHPENVNLEDLIELKEHRVSLLRICVARTGIDAASELIKLCRTVSLDVSVNIIHMSQYSEDELIQSALHLAAFEPSMIYFADSNGSMLPKRVEAIYSRLRPLTPIALGFHAHDNLGLAQYNTIAALNAGAHAVDCALAGMGKGIGNLRTEFFIAYLHSLGLKTYKLEPLLRASNFVRNLGCGRGDIELDEFVRGIFDKSTAQMKALERESLP